MSDAPPRKQLTVLQGTPARGDGVRDAFWRSVEEATENGHGVRGADEAGEDPAMFERAGISRREFVRFMGASVALATTAACTPPQEKILPYTRRPPELVPGIPLRFATSMTLDGHATGLVVTSREGRPIKVEGNPEHPASLGATTVLEQASVLSLYDPDRARTVRARGAPTTYARVLEQVRATSPGRLRVLCEPQSSPTMAALLTRLRERYPGTKVTFYSPASGGAHDGTRLLFGQPLSAQYDFTAARVVVSLDADFLGSMPFATRWAREFADRRRLPSPASDMNRLYVAETCLSPTGMLADHRLPVRARRVSGLAAALVSALERHGRAAAGLPAALVGAIAALGRAGAARGEAEWIEAAARDLARDAGASIVIAGERQPAELHALAQIANLALGNVGRTVRFTAPAVIDDTFEDRQSLAELVTEMRAGQVETLLVLEGNPAYTAPVDLGFGEALRRVPKTLHLSQYENETARACRFVVPAAHYLETWGDGRAYDGTLSLVQPLIAPMFGGVVAIELLSQLVDAQPQSGHELVRAQMREQLGVAAFEPRWEELLQRGFVTDSASPSVAAVAGGRELEGALSRIAAETAPVGLELRFALAPSVYDGRFANNAWLQELPDPATKLTWDNAALLGPGTARQLGVESGQVLEFSVGGRKLRAPALVAAGHAEGSATLHVGYGRSGAERVAAGVGVNAFALRTSAAPYFASGVSAAATQERRRLAHTQKHFRIVDERPIVFLATLAAYRADPEFAQPHEDPQPSLLPEPQRQEPAWAMTIDTSVCTGCSSCVIACQAENNVPVVGKTGVLRSREMHWLRIDLYLTGPAENPQAVNQPMLCQHCEKAPCEYVCPVNATVHSPDGLNEMVYNRCIGTRFCSNNCPYKVRRFNWFDYQDRESTLLQRNPNVTVRARGVMEKCTFCVQRIRQRAIEANLEGRPEDAREVVTACQQACPTRAITFGTLGQREREVVQWREQPRAYAVLHEQGTRPRTMYLAKITNPNPELA